MLLCVTFLFFLLCLSVFQEKHTNEEVEEEERSNEEENNKEVAIHDLVFKLWAFISGSCIHSLSHVVRPSFK